MLDAFVRFCRTPGQRLICVPEDGEEDRELVVPITHRLGAGAGAGAIAMLRERLGGAAGDFARYYARFDGAALFVDERSRKPLVDLAAIERWDELTDRFQGTIEDLAAFYEDEEDEASFGADDEEFEDEDYEPDDEDELPDWVESAVAFGEMLPSGSLYLVATEGAQCGNIYLFDADLGAPELFATCFTEFLARIVYADAARLLRYLTAEFDFDESAAPGYWVPQRLVLESR
jgi:hypothetical protein